MQWPRFCCACCNSGDVQCM